MFRFFSLRRWLAGGVSVVVFLVVQAVFPSLANADVVGYSVQQSPLYWPTLYNPTEISTFCDDCVTPVTFPFPVSFYGQSYSSANVSTNGNVQFGTNNADPYNQCLPSSGFGNPALGAMIAPYWDDLTTFASGDGIFTSTVGSAPYRYFVIEWRAHFYPGTSSSPAVDFRVIFYETYNYIEMSYGPGTGGGNSVTSQATIGLQQTGTGPATQYSCGPANVSPGLDLIYYPQSSQTITFGPLADRQLGTAPFTVSATASSRGPVSFSSDTPTLCGVSGDTVTLLTAGTCTIRASQAGNPFVAPAADVTQSFQITPLAPVVSTQLSASSIAAGATISDTVTLHGSSASSGGSITVYAYSDNGANECTPVLQAAAVGPLTVSGDGTYTADFTSANLPAGPYQFVAVYTGDINNLSASSNCGDEPLTVVPAGTTTASLTDSGGNPIAGAAVTFRPASGPATNATTGPDGTASVVLTPGTYSVTMYYAGGYQTKTVSVTANGPNAVSFATVAVTAQISDPASADLAAESVAHAGNTGTFGPKTPVDSNGQVTFQVLPGTNTFTAYDAGGYQTQTVTVTGPGTVTFATVAVKVTVLKNGSPLTTALVAHAGNTGTFGPKTAVDGNGQVTFQVLPGTNTFTAWDGSAYTRQTLTVTAPSSTSISVT